MTQIEAKHDAGNIDTGAAVAATVPELPYRPTDPREYRPGIGLIGAGSITAAHLGAYRDAGYEVLAICDQDLDRARNRQKEYFPEARITANADDILLADDIEVVDITTHPAARVSLIESAIDAGMHVLSQKPFVLNLDTGEELVEKADKRGVRIAVNQNGRWAPHFSYMREAVRAGVVGKVQSAHLAVHWDHTWVKGTPFEDIDDVILYDFAIHWFDFLASLVGDRITNVFATRAQAVGQDIRPPMLAQALVEFVGGQSSLVFDAHALFGPLNTSYISGTRGTLVSSGRDLGNQTLELHTVDGTLCPSLEGAWFNDGFHGAMAELLCSIEENREPSNGARDNLKSLALCFAAIESSRTGQAVNPGTIRSLP